VTWRPVAFGTASVVAVVWAMSVPGLDAGQRLAMLGCAAALALALFVYTRWIVAMDERFRDVHPRKIAMTSQLTLALPSTVAALLLLLAPWALRSSWLVSPAERVAYLLGIPCLLASAAGAARSMRRDA